ncbi:MAG: TRAP transporter TatT component family protein [Bryobacterales bacterium]|nr:TRAP transporter TatT component family protein [Bryobacterales bacterium]
MLVIAVPSRVLAISVVLVMSLAGCSVRRFAVNRIGDALAAGGSTFESDDDLELVGEALPFGLKLIESLLAESPRHRGLLLAACRGFTLYSYAYVHQEADRVAPEDVERAERLRVRARRLYLRARSYGLRALDLAYPGITQRLEQDPAGALARIRRRDVPLLYWNAAALGLAISVSRGDAAMLARLPEVEALLARALELDESWQEGSLHEFQLVFAASRPGGPPDFERIRRHFERARQLSRDERASVFVAYAEAVSVRRQNRREFRELLERALAVDPDRRPQYRLSNLMAQSRARWRMERADPHLREEETGPNVYTQP